jgi:hypothetical protein
VAGGAASTVKAGWELLGAGIEDPQRPLLPLDDDGRAARQKLLIDAPSRRREGRGVAFFPTLSAKLILGQTLPSWEVPECT